MVTWVGLGPHVREKRWNPWDYYGDPEGHALGTKLLAVNAYAGVVGGTIAVHDLVLYSKPQGIGPVIGRFSYMMAPFLGAASAFATGTFFSCKIRGKDDPWNYFFGGMASGSVVGAWRSCVMTGVLTGVAFGVYGFFKKVSKMQGYDMHPQDPKPILGTVWSVRHDFTLTRDPGKGWTSDPNEV